MSHRSPNVSVAANASKIMPQDVPFETVDGATPNQHPVAMVTPSDLNSKGEKQQQKVTKVTLPPTLPKPPKPLKPLVSPKSSLRKKVLTESATVAANGAQSVFDTDSQLDSYSDTVSSVRSSPSLHSLQNRIIAATDTTSVGNTEPLQQLSTTMAVNVGAENGAREKNEQN